MVVGTETGFVSMFLLRLPCFMIIIIKAWAVRSANAAFVVDRSVSPRLPQQAHYFSPTTKEGDDRDPLHCRPQNSNSDWSSSSSSSRFISSPRLTFHLLSLQYTEPVGAFSISTTFPPHDSHPLPQHTSSHSSWSKVVTDIWRWKDAVLGDGRDFFIPRPKTLQKLALYLRNGQNDNDNGNMIQECIILSNCARFEILLVLLEHDHQQQSLEANDCTEDVNEKDSNRYGRLRLDISRKLVEQAHYYEHQVHTATKLMVSSLDWPDVILASTTTDPKAIGTKAQATSELGMANNDRQQNEDYEDTQKALELQSYWTHLTNLEEIMDHLARVACGMALRPRRPQRPVPFRPFSSRDAHILLQLKRTIQAFSSKQLSSSSSLSLIELLKLALQAGKAARNPQRVPQLQALYPYGSGDSQKDCTEPPVDLLQNVTQAVVEMVIEPTVQECMEKVLANEQAIVISTFRSRCQSFTETTEELQWMNRELHRPTVELRKGHNHITTNSSLFEDLVAEIRQRLEEKRQRQR